MSSTYELLENNQAKISFTISPADFEQAIQTVYNRQKNKISIPGFRKGKVSRQIIEQRFGKDYFWDDAVNSILGPKYREATQDLDIKIVSRAEFHMEDASLENGVQLVATVYTSPDVNITKDMYTGLSHGGVALEEVSDEAINAKINQELEQNARMLPISDRNVKDGDITIINFAGYVDDVAFEGGTAEDYRLVIGSGQFIPGFEDQLIDAPVGQEVDVNVTFPEEYPHENLAGKPALFKVTVNEIYEKQLPDQDDDFAQDVSEFDTFDEYKDNIRKELAEEKDMLQKQNKLVKLLEALAAKVEINIPQPMVEEEVDKMMENFYGNVTQSGMNFDDYLTNAGQTIESLQQVYAPTAYNSVRSRLLLDKIAELEGLEASDDEMKKEVEGVINASFESDTERFENYMANLPEEVKKGIKEDVRRQKAAELLLESAVE